MATTTLNLEPQTQRAARGHRVYMRARWTHDWTLVTDLYAEEVNWRLAPAIGDARLIWRFGRGLLPTTLTFAQIARLTSVRRQFVKIEIDAHAVTAAEIAAEAADPNDTPAPLTWYGTIELDEHTRTYLLRTPDGVLFEGGEQTLSAVSLEANYYRHPLRGATWLGADGADHRSERPFVFNRPGPDGAPEGNRAASRGVYGWVFSSQIGVPDRTWTSKKIVEYLLNYEAPSGPGGAHEFFATLDPEADTLIPDWDTPVIDPEPAATVGELFNQLLPRSRMLSWKIRVDDADNVYLTPVSHFGSDVDTDLGKFKANPHQLILQSSNAAAGSPDTTFHLSESDIPVIDQVRVRGARRTSTCTLSYNDDTLTLGWPNDLETEYLAGFSGNAGYAALSTDQKQAANQEIRRADRLFPVFRRFAIPDEWTQKVKDGLGGGTEKPVFLANDAGGSAVKLVCPRELELAPTLALKEGYDYSTVGSLSLRVPPVKVSDGPFNRAPAIVLMLTPDWTGGGSAPYVQVDSVFTAAEEVSTHRNGHFSGRVEVPARDRAVLIHVDGQPQHILEGADYTRLPVDEHPGQWNWRQALCTVTLYDDRYCEGVWPTDANTDAAVTTLRRELLVTAGDQYKQDYIVPGTVIGINPADRQPQRCTDGGWANDDRKILAARAQQVFQYYGQTRRALHLTTPLMTAQISLGDYVQTVGRSGNPQTVGTVISQISLRIPQGARPRPPQLSFQTSLAELEPGEILNRVPDAAAIPAKRAALAAAK